MEQYYPFSSFPLLFTFIVIFLFMLILKLLGKGFRIRSNNLTTPNLPPGPWKLPVLGSVLHLVGGQPHHVLRDLAKKYGALMHLQLGELSYIVVSSPETAAQVMKTHDTLFANRPSTLATSIITYNTRDIGLAPYGDYWRQMRKICTLEMLSAKRVQSFKPAREEEVSKLVRAISSEARGGLMVPVNLSKMLHFLTYAIVSRTTLGGECKEKEDFILLSMEITKLGLEISVSDMFPSAKLLRFLDGLIRARVERVHQKTDKILENVINEHKAARKQMSKGGSSDHTDQGEESDDLVDVLLRLQEHGDLQVPLTTDDIKAVLLEVFFAGSDTSFATVEWAMSEMLKNPRVLHKAQAEVRQVFNRKGNVDSEGLHELEYLKLVIKETLRLHPPFPLLFPRECSEGCKIDGYDVPAKSRAIINAWAIGRNPEYWNEAETFYPERFINSCIDYKGSHFELIPFGSGRRICPGILYAMANTELPLAQLLYHFDWQLPGGGKLEDLDMDEAFGLIVRRKNDLVLIPTPYSSPTN